MDPNPVMMLVVGLLAAAAVTDDRIPFTNRAVT
jgi:mannose/cellobiose epimerase-like protein (N-acyl-D-glucosamine 2-epimerase family)